jgi:hypothetical protein
MSNLDAIINNVGFKIANILDENIINKLLGVLANDGVYAMWVYSINKLKDIELLKFLLNISLLPIQLKDNKQLKQDDLNFLIKLYDEIQSLNKEISNLKKQKKNQEVKNKIEELRDKQNEYKNKYKSNYEFFQTLSEDINQLLFFKEMVEKALIYARYHAKAMGDE